MVFTAFSQLGAKASCRIALIATGSGDVALYFRLRSLLIAQVFLAGTKRLIERKRKRSEGEG